MALTVNGKGDLVVDGTLIPENLDGTRTFQVLQEGVENDALELGPAGAVKLYRNLAKTPGRLGKVLKTSQRFSRELDADKIAGR